MLSYGMDKENEAADNRSGDAGGWVRAQLAALSMAAPKALVGEAVAADLLLCLQNLLSERALLAERAAAAGEACVAARGEVGALERAHETVSGQLEATKYELACTSSKLAAVQGELRQARAQWAAERAELEGRVFQTLALQQSTLGSMRKKEKDFSGLQSQLMRHVRDANKAQGSVIVVSKPLPRGWQERTEAPSLRDAEIAGLRSSLLASNVSAR